MQNSILAPFAPLSYTLTSGILAAFVAGGGVIIIVGVILWIWLARRRKDKGREEAWHAAVNAPDAAMAPSTDRTLDALAPGETALAILTVEKSDDLKLVGQRIEIHKPHTALGRSADNDITFAKDSPVSRTHAEIREHDGQLWFSPLITVDNTGVPKLPTFGTFVNDQPVNSAVALHDGDLIRLGKRVDLRVELIRHEAEPEATQDQLALDDAKTMVAFGNGPVEDPVKPADEKTVLAVGTGASQDQGQPVDEKTMLVGGTGPAEDQVKPAEEKTVLAIGAGPAEDQVKPGDEETMLASDKGLAPDQVKPADEETMLASDKGLAPDQVKPSDDKTMLAFGTGPSPDQVKPGDEETLGA